MAQTTWGTISTCVPAPHFSVPGPQIPRHAAASRSVDPDALLAASLSAFTARATRVSPIRTDVPTRTGGRLGRYRLIERVGQGRQAEVWKAVQIEPVVTEVALKLLDGSKVDHCRRAQLRHEAERGARLDGPALLPTYEFGEFDGVVFMAMPLVVGCTLASIIDQRREMLAGGRIAGLHRLATAPAATYTRDVVALLAQVARAAADAHGAQVVHRDIKPGNILVRLDHEKGVFLCDFGLARDLDIATPAQLRDGAGSPLYMAPERLLRRPADEIRCDVYALGITLYEALLLTTPFDVPEELPSSVWAPYLATAVLRRPSSIWPKIPLPLEVAILRATARDPSRRHPSARHFAHELERFLEGEASSHEATAVSNRRILEVPARPMAWAACRTSVRTRAARGPASAASWGASCHTTP